MKIELISDDREIKAITCNWFQRKVCPLVTLIAERLDAYPSKSSTVIVLGNLMRF